MSTTEALNGAIDATIAHLSRCVDGSSFECDVEPALDRLKEEVRAALAAAAPSPQPADLMSVVEEILNIGHMHTEDLARLRSAWEASAPSPAVIPEGWKLVLVNEGFGGLMDGLERAHRKGYMPDAITEDYEGFDYRDAAPGAHPAPSLPVCVAPSIEGLKGQERTWSGNVSDASLNRIPSGGMVKISGAADPMLNGLTASEPVAWDCTTNANANSPGAMLTKDGAYAEYLRKSGAWIVTPLYERAASETAETASVAGPRTLKAPSREWLLQKLDECDIEPMAGQGEVPADPSAANLTQAEHDVMWRAMRKAANIVRPSADEAMSRRQFEAFHAGRKNRGAKRRSEMFNQLADGTYADESESRHWWTWQTAVAFALDVLATPPAQEAGLSLTDIDEALRNLVDALDRTNWSSWQTTASFSVELERARAILAAAHEH